MKRAVRWVFLFLLAFEIILLYTGLASPAIVAILVSITEGTALVLFLSIVIPAAVKITGRVRAGTQVIIAVQNEFKSFLPKPVLSMVKFEIGLWAAFFQGIRRKRDIPEGFSSIDYGREFKLMCIIVACLTPIEIGVVEILCHSFSAPLALHLIILILTLYASLWIIGLVLSIRVYPHLVNKNELVFRYCWYHVIRIDTNSIDRVVQEKRECIKNKTIEYGEDLIALNDMRETNISLYFKQPYCPIIDGELASDGVIRFSFSADNPQAAYKSISSILVPHIV